MVEAGTARADRVRLLNMTLLVFKLEVAFWRSGHCTEMIPSTPVGRF